MLVNPGRHGTMLHWPDSMFSYLTTDNILFSNNAFGQQYATEYINVKIFNLAKTDKNDVITEIFKSKVILMGSSTINRGILVSVAGILEEIKGFKFKSEKAAAFGCYGWSGESTEIISNKLDEAGFDVFDEGLKEMWNPDEEGVRNCVE